MGQDQIRIKQVENATLKTFQEEIPSIYFSDNSDREFAVFLTNAEQMYRNLFKFPPKMFAGADVIDFGAGTGEHTVCLSQWGARCTLVEMNEKALAIAKKVFKYYAADKPRHFVHSSIFDFESPALYDIVTCRGVLSHTADKQGAFKKIAGFLKPGGYLIFGDPNKAGGFQNMLQRFAVYHFAKSWDEMVEVCEKLYKEDIDRSQLFVPRTRRAIIFDRWVIQSQDDPSVDEVMSWLSANNLTFYSSYPPFVLPLQGDSAYHQPKFDAAKVIGMASIAETVWMLHKNEDKNTIREFGDSWTEYAQHLTALTAYMANFNSSSTMDINQFAGLADQAQESFRKIGILEPLQFRLEEFLSEAKEFVFLVLHAELAEIKNYIDSCQYLFKGACGVRHVDFIAYKEK